MAASPTLIGKWLEGSATDPEKIVVVGTGLRIAGRPGVHIKLVTTAVKKNRRTNRPCEPENSTTEFAITPA
ncbi:MAG: hypothetical protein ACREUA_07310 [Burkholderiales bacterium]